MSLTTVTALLYRVGDADGICENGECTIRELLEALQTDPSEAFMATLMATAFGAVIGGLVTYRVTRRLALDQAKRDDARLDAQLAHDRAARKAQVTLEEKRLADRQVLEDQRIEAQNRATQELYETERAARQEERLGNEIAGLMEELQAWRADTEVNLVTAETTHLSRTVARLRRCVIAVPDRDHKAVFDWIGMNLLSYKAGAFDVQRRLNGIIDALVDWRLDNLDPRDVVATLKALP